MDRNDDELGLLNRSTILAVYAVLKGNRGNNSIILGLAKDKETGESFHWLTDLKTDISVLVND